jgi:hypothetical protein
MKIAEKRAANRAAHAARDRRAAALEPAHLPEDEGRTDGFDDDASRERT